jgi:uracil-DNA glycosylase family 4
MSAEVVNQIAKEVAACTKCPLSQGRCKAVPGEGSPTARVMFIGEGPGYHEDQQGRPFVGPSGQLLDHLFNKIKLKREDVFITNVVKCRPPNNRDPEPNELEACKDYLERQIAAINPRLIVTLGRISMARYWPGQKISLVHGQTKSENGRLYMPMFHPSFALRDRNGPGMAKFKEDGLCIPGLLEKAEEIARTELWGFASSQNEDVPATAQNTLPIAQSLAEKKSAYPENPAPVKVESAVSQTGEALVEQPETLSLLPTEAQAEQSESAPTEKALPRRKKREGEAQVEQSESVPPEKALPRRKRKEGETQAEQLTMF